MMVMMTPAQMNFYWMPKGQENTYSEVATT